MSKWMGRIFAGKGIPPPGTLKGGGTVQAGDFFVDPNVPYDTGSGTLADPWNIRHAFQSGGTALRGHTVWMRGGTYTPVGDGSGLDSYWVAFNGLVGSRITCRSYPGEWAKIDGGTTGIGTPVLIINGNYFTLRDFEVFSSASTDRITTTPGPAPGDILFGHAVEVDQTSLVNYDGVWLINMIMHDTSQGPTLWKWGTNMIVYGNIIYYTGWEGPDDGHGHGIYSDNWATNPGTKQFYNNISFRHFGECAQGYNESGMTQYNYDWQENIFFAYGVSTVFPDQRLWMLGGDGTPACDSSNIFSNNYCYEEAGGSGSAMLYGYNVNPWDTPTIQDNYMPQVGQVWISSGSSANITGNTLTHTEGDDFDIGSQNTFLTKPLTGTYIKVLPNTYETGRGHIAVYNWDLDNTVDVPDSELSAILSNGDRYVVYNSQNVLGQPVTYGIYNGVSITLPMTTAGGLSQAAPNGYATPAATWPEFNAFLVRKY